jgi:hypothetical protein
LNYIFRIVDLVNIHLFHDENNLAFFEVRKIYLSFSLRTFKILGGILQHPTQYADNRARALNHTLKELTQFNTDQSNLFIFGDFNFRLDIRSFIKVSVL